MLFSKRRILVSVAALSATVVLAGCNPTQDGDPSPPPQSATFKALYNLQTGYVPWPNDAFFAGTTDGTLNIPAPLNAPPFTTMGAELNTLDGFSTSAPMDTSFDNAIDGASLSGTTVHLIEMYLSDATGGPASQAELDALGLPHSPYYPAPISKVMQYGTDFTAAVSPDYDSYGKILRITPLKPLRPSTGAVRIGYYVLLTNGIKDVRGVSSVPDDLYAAFKAAPADCGSFSDATSIGLCRLAKAHLGYGQAVGINPASVTVSWGFTTQSVEDSFNAIGTLVPAQPIGVAPTGMSTAAVGLYGKADIFVGTTQLPYYLTAAANNHDAAAVLQSYWRGPAGSYITRFNPMPVATSTVTIPLLVTVPNATAHGGTGCPKPAAGWPVAVVQHGITRNRTDALAIADSFADACFIVASIDLPLHGVTSMTNPLYMGPIERTFNVDLVNNTTGAAGPDGLIDASGAHYLNLVSPLTARDNLRQAEADLMTFTNSLSNLDVTADGAPDVDPTRIHYVGLSLGAIVGGAHVQHSDTRTATLAVPGGVLSKLVLDSQSFGPVVRAGLAKAGLVDNSTLFNNRIIRDFQTVVDAGDPINHVSVSKAMQPVHLIEVTGDTVVPNNSTDRLVTAGSMTRLTTAGAHPVTTSTPVWVKFSAGSHGSLFDPTASLAATVEMQSQTVQFAASAVAPGGPFVVITDTSVISP